MVWPCAHASRSTNPNAWLRQSTTSKGPSQVGGTPDPHRAAAPTAAISSTHQALVRNNLVAPGAGPRPKRRNASSAAPPTSCGRKSTPPGSCWPMSPSLGHGHVGRPFPLLCGRQGERAGHGRRRPRLLRLGHHRYGLPNQVLSDNGLCLTGRLKNVQVASKLNLRALGVGLLHAHHPRPAASSTGPRTMKDRRSSPALPASRSSKGSSTSSGHAQRRASSRIDRRRDAGRALRPGSPKTTTSPPFPSTPPEAITRKVSSCGNVHFKRHMISGGQWEYLRPGVDVIDGVVHLFYGDQLVRALVFRPGVLRGRPRPRGGAEAATSTLLSGTGCQA